MYTDKFEMLSSWESDYIGLLMSILRDGEDVGDERTGVGTQRIVASMLKVPALRTQFPALTIRKVSFRIAFWETMFFLTGQTDTRFLEDKGIEIWKGNTRREFLDKRGLNHLSEGDMGKGYGYQWRNFGGVDQLKDLFQLLKNSAHDRRAIISCWNPGEITQMALPPCHLLHQYTLRKSSGEWFLDNAFYMRSIDTIYGLPYNLMSYAFLNIVFANHLSHLRGELINPGDLTWFGFDCHIYNNQLPMTTEMLEREPLPAPLLVLNKPIQHLDDLLSLDYKDVKLIGYQSHGKCKEQPEMAV